MKIASSELQFTASHSSAQSREIEESLKMWSGPQRPDFENRGRGNVGGERVVLSDAGKAAAAADSAAPVDETLDEDPKTLLIRLMLEMMTGKSVRTISASELSGKSAPAAPQAPPTAAANNGRPATAGFGIEYDYRASYSESESTSFAAN
ncbi:MAG TPA: VCBS repeat-containing protein, partial [Azonexus sp.]|nr:VCBS repeat-containing protein [Azonexus sp.]